MEFRLIYAGNWLKSATGTKNRVWEKHALRKYFHDQLKALWHVHPVLSYYSNTKQSFGPDTWSPTLAEQIAHQYERAGIGCIPLANKSNGLVCELDILFLRPGPPGEIVKHGGDIDNRLKTLLDSLRMPEDESEMKEGANDDPTPNPIYCLLQDDSLITKLTVSVDTLLFDMEHQTESSVCAIITVNTKSISAFSTPQELLT